MDYTMSFVHLFKKNINLRKFKQHVKYYNLLKFKIIFRAQFLWADYDKSNCTWEPTNHIPPSIRDTIVSSDRLQSAATALDFAVHRLLRSRNNYLSITFDADVYRHCFGLSTNKLVYEERF